MLIWIWLIQQAIEADRKIPFHALASTVTGSSGCTTETAVAGGLG
jgi:hypothetical protein